MLYRDSRVLGWYTTVMPSPDSCPAWQALPAPADWACAPPPLAAAARVVTALVFGLALVLVGSAAHADTPGFDPVAERGEEIDGWTLDRVEEHPEFHRYFWRDEDGDEAGVEVTVVDGSLHVQPAPGHEAPEPIVSALSSRTPDVVVVVAPPEVVEAEPRTAAEIYYARARATWPAWLLALGLVAWRARRRAPPNRQAPIEAACVGTVAAGLAWSVVPDFPVLHDPTSALHIIARVFSGEPTFAGMTSSASVRQGSAFAHLVAGLRAIGFPLGLVPHFFAVAHGVAAGLVYAALRRVEVGRFIALVAVFGGGATLTAANSLVSFQHELLAPLAGAFFAVALLRAVRRADVPSFVLVGAATWFLVEAHVAMFFGVFLLPGLAGMEAPRRVAATCAAVGAFLWTGAVVSPESLASVLRAGGGLGLAGLVVGSAVALGVGVALRGRVQAHVAGAAALLGLIGVGTAVLSFPMSQLTLRYAAPLLPAAIVFTASLGDRGARVIAALVAVAGVVFPLLLPPLDGRGAWRISDAQAIGPELAELGQIDELHIELRTMDRRALIQASATFTSDAETPESTDPVAIELLRLPDDVVPPEPWRVIPLRGPVDAALREVSPWVRAGAMAACEGGECERIHTERESLVAQIEGVALEAEYLLYRTPVRVPPGATGSRTIVALPASRARPAACLPRMFVDGEPLAAPWVVIDAAAPPERIGWTFSEECRQGADAVPTWVELTLPRDEWLLPWVSPNAANFLDAPIPPGTRLGPE